MLDAQARLELIDGELVVYRDPSGDDFLSKQSVDRSGAVAPLAAPGSTVHVADLLP